MKIGRSIDRSHEAAVVPSNLPMPRKKKLKYAFWARLPVGGSRRCGLEGEETETGGRIPGRLLTLRASLVKVNALRRGVW